LAFKLTNDDRASDQQDDRALKRNSVLIIEYKDNWNYDNIYSMIQLTKLRMMLEKTLIIIIRLKLIMILKIVN